MSDVVHERFLSRERLADVCQTLRDTGQRVVFTNGCFDLLHPGHLRLITQAARQGEVLVVAVNDDASVRRLKGPDRPVYPVDERAEILLAVRGVDWVTSFPEDTPIETVEQIRPDVLVKGDEYLEKDIVGAAFVRGYGGEVVRVSMKAGHATRNIVQRIQKAPTKNSKTKGRQ